MRSSLLPIGTFLFKATVAISLCVYLGVIDVASPDVDAEALLGEMLFALCVILLLEKAFYILIARLRNQSTSRQEL